MMRIVLFCFFKLGTNPSAIGSTLVTCGNIQILGPGAVFGLLYNKYKYSVQFVDSSQSSPDQKQIEGYSKTRSHSKSKKTKNENESSSKRKDETQFGNTRKKFRLSFKGRKSRDAVDCSAHIDTGETVSSSDSGQFKVNLDKTDSFNFGALHQDPVLVSGSHCKTENFSQDVNSPNESSELEMVGITDKTLTSSERDTSMDISTSSENIIVTQVEAKDLEMEFGNDFVDEIQKSFNLQRLTSLNEIPVDIEDSSVDTFAEDNWVMDKGLMVFSKNGLVNQKKVRIF